MKSKAPQWIGFQVFLVMTGSTAIAGEKAMIDQCVNAAQAEWVGDMVKMEKKTEGGKPVYEFEVKGKDATMEFECDARTGKIIERETEVSSPDDPRFKSQSTLSLEKAKEIALKKHPGQIVEMEFEIEADGRASYEFDIKKANGQEVKIEIDAKTGDIAEDDEIEIYQIGLE